MGLQEPNNAAPSQTTDTPPDSADPPSAWRLAAAQRWALLLVRLYECLPLLCQRCGAPMRIVAFVQELLVIKRILHHVGEPIEAPEVLPSRPPPQAEIEFDESAGAAEWPDEDQTGGRPDDEWE